MRKRAISAVSVMALAVILSGFSCSNSTKNLAVASDAIAHALLNAQTAAKQAVQSGVITADDEKLFEQYLTRVSQAGLVLNNAIRAGESAQSVSQKVNVFLDVFNQLNTTGIAGIKNPALQLTISTIITGAETSVAIISATVGGK